MNGKEDKGEWGMMWLRRRRSHQLVSTSPRRRIAIDCKHRQQRACFVRKARRSVSIYSDSCALLNI